MTDDLKKRLTALEACLMQDPSYCLVELPDGTEAETTMEEWYKHRQEWRWLKMTSGRDNAILLLLAAIDEEVAEHAMNEGDTEAAAWMKAEAARFLAEYEQRPRIR